MLNLTAAQWKHRAEIDFANKKLHLSNGRRLTYPELLELRGPQYRSEVEMGVMEEKERACQAALERLADALERARPDVVVIVGDDQAELFTPDNQPAFAIFHGEEIATTTGKYGKGAPDWMLQVGRGYLMEDVYRAPAAADFAAHLIERLVRDDVDVAAVAAVNDPSRAGFGHAYGFIIKRLFRQSIPVVPVLLNTYFPPNVPTANRCYEIGRRLRKAITEHPSELRVAIVASGGLSHFVVEEDFDQKIIHALKTRDEEALRSIPPEALRSGTSETLNWILTAGAVDSLPVQSLEYYPLHRTEAGTGVGAAFCIWEADARSATQ
nr:extradiol ring-cleavage dioxygenase [Pseudomonas sp.]